MHSSRMRTARSLIVSPYLVVSHARPRATTHPPWSNHACTLPPGATMHAPLELPCMPPWEQPHMPPHNHTPPPEQPHTPPGATTHAPPRATMHTAWSSHACPPRATTHTPQSNHAPPPPLEQPCMPPRATMQPPEQPCMPPEQPHMSPQEQPRMPPPVNRMTNRCKNITLPQTSFAGGNKPQTSKKISLSLLL